MPDGRILPSVIDSGNPVAHESNSDALSVNHSLNKGGALSGCNEMVRSFSFSAPLRRVGSGHERTRSMTPDTLSPFQPSGRVRTASEVHSIRQRGPKCYSLRKLAEPGSGCTPMVSLSEQSGSSRAVSPFPPPELGDDWFDISAFNPTLTPNSAAVVHNSERGKVGGSGEVKSAEEGKVERRVSEGSVVGERSRSGLLTSPSQPTPLFQDSGISFFSNASNSSLHRIPPIPPPIVELPIQTPQPPPPLLPTPPFTNLTGIPSLPSTPQRSTSISSNAIMRAYLEEEAEEGAVWRSLGQRRRCNSTSETALQEPTPNSPLTSPRNASNSAPPLLPPSILKHSSHHLGSSAWTVGGNEKNLNRTTSDTLSMSHGSTHRLSEPDVSTGSFGATLSTSRTVHFDEQSIQCGTGEKEENVRKPSQQKKAVVMITEQKKDIPSSDSFFRSAPCVGSGTVRLEEKLVSPRKAELLSPTVVGKPSLPSAPLPPLPPSLNFFQVSLTKSAPPVVGSKGVKEHL